MLEGNSLICKLGINTILSDKIPIERFQQFAQVLAQNHTFESLTLELRDLEEMHFKCIGHIVTTNDAKCYKLPTQHHYKRIQY
jgi:hypothetical protein